MIEGEEIPYEWAKTLANVRVIEVKYSGVKKPQYFFMLSGENIQSIKSDAALLDILPENLSITLQKNPYSFILYEKKTPRKPPRSIYFAEVDRFFPERIWGEDLETRLKYLARKERKDLKLAGA